MQNRHRCVERERRDVVRRVQIVEKKTLKPLIKYVIRHKMFELIMTAMLCCNMFVIYLYYAKHEMMYVAYLNEIRAIDKRVDAIEMTENKKQ
jgi:hypothetical protein